MNPHGRRTSEAAPEATHPMKSLLFLCAAAALLTGCPKKPTYEEGMAQLCDLPKQIPRDDSNPADKASQLGRLMNQITAKNEHVKPVLEGLEHLPLEGR